MSSLAMEPCTLAGMNLRNRIVRSATFDACGSPDGTVSPEQLDYSRMLAENQVGLIITPMSGVTPHAISKTQNGAYDDRFIPSHQAFADAIHQAGGKVVVQINHIGDRSITEERISPSGITSFGAAGPSREMTVEEIAAATAAFASAAARMKQAGYDGVQIHLAHGYLLHQFISPIYNKRTDAYGGCVENRFRFAGEVISAVRAAVGPDYPILVKLNSNVEENDDAFEADLLWMCSRCKLLGVDAVELSGYNFTPLGRQGQHNYYLDRAVKIRAGCGIPVILIGGIRSKEDIEQVLAAGVDLVSLCRPFICEPDLIPKMIAGQQQSACLNCSKCFGLIAKYQTEKIRCILHKKAEA